MKRTGKRRTSSAKPRQACAVPPAGAIAASSPVTFLGMSRVEWICAGLLLVVSLCIFWKAFVDPAGMCREDAGYLVQPWHEFAAAEIREGRFPHWNPYCGFGIPCHAALLSSVMYPLRWPMFWMSYEAGNAATLILHHFLASLFMFLLARRVLKCREAPSMIAAVSFGYCGYAMGHITHAPYVMAYPWFVLTILLAFKAIDESRLLPAVGAGAALGMSLLAGAAQPTLTLAFGLCAWAGIESAVNLARKLRGNNETWRRVVMPLLAAGIAMVFAIGIGSAQYIPSRLQSSLSTLGGRMSWEYVTQICTHPVRNIVYMTAPFYWGNYRLGSWGEYNWQEHSTYVGIVPMIFAAVALAARWREKWVIRLAVVIVTASLISFGKYGAPDGCPSVFRLLYDHFPIFDQLRNPTRFFVWAEFAIACLAALGAQRLMDAGAERLNFKRIIPGLAVAVITVASLVGSLASLAEISADPQVLAEKVAKLGPEDTEDTPRAAQALNMADAVIRETDVPTWFGVMVGMASAVTGGMLLVRRRPISLRQMGGMAGLLVLDMGMFSAGSLMHSQKDRIVDQPTPIVKEMQKELGLQRYVTWLGGKDETSRFRAMIYRIRNVWANNVGIIYLPRQCDIAQRVHRCDNPRLVDLAGVRYVLGLTKDGQRAIPNPHAYPRAFLARQILVMPDGNSAHTETIEGTSDLFDVAVLEQPATPLPPVVKEANRPREPVEISQPEPGRIVMKTRSAAPRQLVLTEAYHPEWKCMVDGAATPIYRTDSTFMSVRLDAGAHDVEYWYDPASFRMGLAVTCAATALALILWMASWFWKKRKADGGNAVAVTAEDVQL